MLGALAGLIGSSIGNKVDSAVSAYAQYQGSKSLMRYQQKLARRDAKWSAENLPFYNRTGMENAGFNPILAYSQGTGEMSNPSYPSFSPDMHSDVSSALNTYNQLRMSDSQVDLLRARAAESLARQANLSSASALNRYKLEHPDTLRIGSKFFNLNLPMSVSSALQKSKELTMQIGRDSVNELNSAGSLFKDFKGNSSPTKASDFFDRIPDFGKGYRPNTYHY